jgi:hypothetical protein
MKRGRFAAMFAVALTLAVFAVGAPAALADDQAPTSGEVSVVTPLDATGCTGTYAGDQIQNCVAIFGTASYLEEVQGLAWTHFGSVVGHEEITGPSIPNGHLNSPTQTINTTTDNPLIAWAPYGPVADGNYCAIFWQNVSGGYSENGPACEYVS